jgi:hypothetical protein
MELLFNFLYKINIADQNVSREDFGEVNNDNINLYIMNLLNNIAENDGDREYEFERTALTMKTLIQKIIDNREVEDTGENIAERLLTIETNAQEQIRHLGREIQKGILIISYIQMTEDEKKIIISKVDYTEFIEEVSGSIKNGLPTKKKIFKSFVANISTENGQNVINKLVTYDSNSSKATYWWKTFLELKEIRNDEVNSKNAYNAIKTKVLLPICKKHKSDYLCLWNATVAYFRTDGNFNINHYKDEIIGNYHPHDPELNIDKLKTKISELPQKNNFDCTFAKKPEVIKDKFKNNIKLTNELDLVIKYDIQDLERTIQAHLDDENNKYIMIRSDTGYDYAKRNEND